MKHPIAFIFCLLMALTSSAQVYAPLNVNRTNLTLPPGSQFFRANSNSVWGTVEKSFDIRDMLFDADADSYALEVGCTDVDERVRLSQFVTGLKDLGLWCDIKLLASLRTQHQLASGSTAVPIKGNYLTVVGSPTRTTNGFGFDGTSSAALTFTNPFTGPITNMAVVVGFKANPGTHRAVISGYQNSPNRSFGIFAHGGVGAGTQTNLLEVTLSGDGSTSFPLGGGRYIGDFATTGHRQLFGFSYSPNEYWSQPNNDLRRSSTTNGTFGTIFNPAATWEIGRNPGATLGLNGEVAFVAIWARPLQPAEYLAVRRLYASTIGAGWLADPNWIIEGDSITSGGGPDPNARIWAHQLLSDPNYGPRIVKRNVSEGGNGTAVMLTQQPSEVLHHGMDGRYFGRHYLLVNGGINDLASISSTNSYLNLSNIWSNARRVGLRVVAFTITPSLNFTAPQAADRLTLNNMIRNNTNLYDHLVDLGNVPNLTNAANTTYFQSDGVHLTLAGHTEVFKAITNAIPNP